MAGSNWRFRNSAGRQGFIMSPYQFRFRNTSDSPRGRDIRLRLGEIKQTTQIRTLAFEIRSRQSLNNPTSVGEILLSEFYRSIGLSENFIVARIERRLGRRGLLPALEKDYEVRFGIPWKSSEGRDDLM